MRVPALLCVLMVACTPVAGGYTVQDVAGNYRWELAPEIVDEIHLRTDGGLEWSHRDNAFRPVRRGRGRWTLSGSRVRVEPEGDFKILSCDLGDLVTKRYGGHIYLVDADYAGWFDDHGPMVEFCMHREGAPLVFGPPGDLHRLHETRKR